MKKSMYVITTSGLSGDILEKIITESKGDCRVGINPGPYIKLAFGISLFYEM